MIPEVRLREVQAGDLPIFFDQMRDPDAVQMAAFTSRDPHDRAAFDALWARIRAAAANRARTILADGQVAGSISSYPDGDRLEVTYWLGREYWGRGIATAALQAFLRQETRRPLHARAAADNTASLRVLEKCGFVPIGREHSYANARGAAIDEILLELP